MLKRMAILFIAAANSYCLTIGVESPQIEIAKAKFIALGDSHQIDDRIYFRPSRIFKGDLKVNKDYRVTVLGRAAEDQPQLTRKIEQSVITTAEGKPFIMLGEESVDEKGEVYVIPRKPMFSQWPQGMKRFPDFPYKTLDECAAFVEQQLNLVSQAGKDLEPNVIRRPETQIEVTATQMPLGSGPDKDAPITKYDEHSLPPKSNSPQKSISPESWLYTSMVLLLFGSVTFEILRKIRKMRHKNTKE